MGILSRSTIAQCELPLKYLSSTYFNTRIQCRQLNNNSASICKIHRTLYERTYPTSLVLPNGASINIQYHEPRKIIKLPLDLSTLSEQEKKLRIERLKPKKKVKIEEDIEDEFDSSKYLKLLKK